SGFPAEAGRYHLYVSLACPWAHRTLIVRRLKGLEEVIGVTVVDPYMADDGWVFSDRPECGPDPVLSARCLHEIYRRSKVDYSGRVTVPVLFDRERMTIVNNESRSIIELLDTAFAAHAKTNVSLFPPALRESIDAAIDAIYPVINDGVYKVGFAG